MSDESTESEEMLAEAARLLGPCPHYSSWDAARRDWMKAYEAHRKATPVVVDEPECTGASASWCPRCGDCKCPRGHYGDTDLDDRDCPLHGHRSAHAELPQVATVVPDVQADDHRTNADRAHFLAVAARAQTLDARGLIAEELDMAEARGVSRGFARGRLAAGEAIARERAHDWW